jgi:hypothetical protein
LKVGPDSPLTPDKSRVTGHLEWRDQVVERKISGTTTSHTGVFNAHAYTRGTDTCCRTSERPDRVPQLNQAAGLVPESSDETVANATQRQDARQTGDDQCKFALSKEEKKQKSCHKEAQDAIPMIALIEASDSRD